MRCFSFLTNFFFSVFSGELLKLHITVRNDDSFPLLARCCFLPMMRMMIKLTNYAANRLNISISSGHNTTQQTVREQEQQQQQRKVEWKHFAHFFLHLRWFLTVKRRPTTTDGFGPCGQEIKNKLLCEWNEKISYSTLVFISLVVNLQQHISPDN